jgi:hypothetical protein
MGGDLRFDPRRLKIDLPDDELAVISAQIT